MGLSSQMRVVRNFGLEQINFLSKAEAKSEKRIVQDLPAECTITALWFRSRWYPCVYGQSWREASDGQDEGMRLEELSAGWEVVHLVEFQEGEVRAVRPYLQCWRWISRTTGMTGLGSSGSLGTAGYGWGTWGCAWRFLREQKRHLTETQQGLQMDRTIRL